MLRKQKIKLFKLAILVGCIAAIFLAFDYYSAFQKRLISDTRTPEEKAMEALSKNYINVLVLGSDAVIPKRLKDWHGRSDLILVLRINKETKEVSIISIPRDTQISMRKGSITRINAANAIGGYKLARKAVKKLLKMDIKHVLVFSIAGFQELIESVEPIKIYVPKKLSYHDHSGDLHIDIEPGLQEMDAETLTQFLRFRADELGDIGRIQRQHIFFRAAIRKLTETETIFQMPILLNKANRVFLSNMSFGEMFDLGLFFKSLPKENFKSYMIPGNFGEKGYWVVDEERLNAMITEW